MLFAETDMTWPAAAVVIAGMAFNGFMAWLSYRKTLETNKAISDKETGLAANTKITQDAAQSAAVAADTAAAASIRADTAAKVGKETAVTVKEVKNLVNGAADAMKARIAELEAENAALKARP